MLQHSAASFPGSISQQQLLNDYEAATNDIWCIPQIGYFGPKLNALRKCEVPLVTGQILFAYLALHKKQVSVIIMDGLQHLHIAMFTFSS